MNNANITTRFGLIRHAETVWNREKRIQGHQDSPLTPEGERMADRWGLKLREFQWNRILSSDTGRAVATARRVNAYLGLPLETDPGCGSWTGGNGRTRPWPSFGTSRRTCWRFRSVPAGLPAAAGRITPQPVGAHLPGAAGSCRPAPGDSILVVTHGGVLRCLALVWAAAAGGGGRHRCKGLPAALAVRRRDRLALDRPPAWRCREMGAADAHGDVLVDVLMIHDLKKEYFDLPLENYRLTFDDGLYSQYYYYPLLRGHSETLTFFITTSLIREGPVRPQYAGRFLEHGEAGVYFFRAFIEGIVRPS